MENLKFYDTLRQVPREALKQITAGRLKGMSDINPMWRINAMTAAFGPCGIGWHYVITKQWTEGYADTVKAFCNIDLFIKVDGEWSEAIPGTGGSTMLSQERQGPYVNDEAYKMALTDALSVAMKSLGVAADIYFEKGKNIYDYSSKYAMQEQMNQQAVQPQQTAAQALANGLNELKAVQSYQQIVQVWNKYKPYLNDNEEFKAACKAAKEKYPKQ